MGEARFKEDVKTSLTIPDIPCASVDDFGKDNIPTIDEMLELWETSREWLRLRGIQLYGLQPELEMDVSRVWHTPLMSTAAALPYARCIWDEGISPRTFRTKTRLACGQDIFGRDIMLKLVDNDSSQHRIFQTLPQQKSLFTDMRTFPGVLPPIAIIDTPHKYSIVTMPLWGTPLYITDMQDVRQVLTFIRCLLEGLSFLHANRIAHRDICESNMVVNCYRPDRDVQQFRNNLCEHRGGFDVVYAFMDYDQSIQLPPDVSVKDCRRPSDEACMGSDLYKPEDVCLGEPQYNPFAFDVAMLGNLFRVHLSGAVSMVPALPALFDGMTTHVVTPRFSAQEALDFFMGNIESLSQDVLDAPVTLRIDYETMFDPEVYWSKLAPHLQADWSRFRMPPLPRSWHVLNWLIQVPGSGSIIYFVRRALQI
ncbi:hypothetical protein LXA43DRAFT_164645 [Ganoderma leucocontextum]|nr:hypothetical protein LXA43DRAFT_164645 [Ganoderma leucocontextum]